jgi:5'-methylthioadenosine phosphorylase
MKQLGVTDIISVSAVGSLKKNLSPGNFVIIDQFIDRTFARASTFFDEEIVAHVSMAKPVCESLGKCCIAALKKKKYSPSSKRYLYCNGRTTVFHSS